MEFVFTVTEREGQLVLDALRQLPYGAVVGLIDKVQAQAIEQRKAAEVVVE